MCVCVGCAASCNRQESSRTILDFSVSGIINQIHIFFFSYLISSVMNVAAKATAGTVGTEEQKNRNCLPTRDRHRKFSLKPNHISMLSEISSRLYVLCVFFFFFKSIYKSQVHTHTSSQNIKPTCCNFFPADR